MTDLAVPIVRDRFGKRGNHVSDRARLKARRLSRLKYLSAHLFFGASKVSCGAGDSDFAIFFKRLTWRHILRCENVWR